MAAALVFGVQPGLLSRSLTTGLPCTNCGPIRAAACCDACSSEAQACMDCCETYGFDARQSGGTPALSDVTSFVIGAHIPEAPGAGSSVMTFGELKAAQAEADRRALVEKGRAVMRINFVKNPAAGIKKLALALKSS